MPGELNARVQRVIDRLVASGEELGLQVAAYVNGALAIDACAGVTDRLSDAPITGDTLFTSWSTTKGFAATCVHLLADRGKLDYDAPVASYWPEFAQNGKERVTVRQALTHAAAVPQMPEGVTPEMMCDWDAMCRAIAAHAPLWEPGTVIAYHAWTFGWIVGEIVRRVDGRPLAQFAREELCGPLGIADFYLGIPDEVEGRVAPLVQDASHLAAAAKYPAITRLAMPPQVTSAQVVNRPDVRRASLPGGGGIMNARAIARHYALLANGGALDGVRLLSARRIDEARALQTDAHDAVLAVPNRKGLGYMLSGNAALGGVMAMGRAEGAFGHPGNGGSIGFADPARKLAFGLTKNLMKVWDDPKQATAVIVANVVREYLDASPHAA